MPELFDIGKVKTDVRVRSSALTDAKLFAAGTTLFSGTRRTGLRASRIGSR